MAAEPQATFVSYSRDDSDFALRLAEDLKSAGATVWLDQLDIKPGERWARSVQDALTASPRILVILSPSSVDSTNVDDEISFALEEHKTVIPVLYRECKIPFRLRPYQHVDFRTDYARGLRILLSNLAVNPNVEQPRQQTPPQPIIEPPHLQPEAPKPIHEEPATKPKPEAKPEAKPEPKPKAIKKPKPEQSPAPSFTTPSYKITPDPLPPQAPPVHIEAKPTPTNISVTTPSPPPQEITLPSTSAFQQWAPCVAMLLLTFLSYSSRTLFSLLYSGFLVYDLTSEQQGLALLGFSILYMLASPFWGLWMDRAGLWLPTLSAIVIWSLALAGHGLSQSPTVLILAHSILGFGIAATVPAVFKAVVDTLPATRRAVGLGIAYTGGPLATVFAAPLFVPIAVRFSWHYACTFAALLSIVWIIPWLMLRATISQSGSSPPQATEESRWARNFFANVAVYGFGAIPVAFVFSYSARIASIRIESRSFIFWLTSAGLIAGYLFFGKLADHLQPRGTRPGLIFFILSIAGLLLVPLQMAALRSYKLDMAIPLLACQMFLGAGFIIMALSDGIATLPRRHTAFFAGVCTFAWALITAITSPTITRLLNLGVGGPSAFVIVAVLPLLGAILWRVLSTTPTAYPSPLPTEKAST